VYVMIGIRLEERKLLLIFGSAYEAYRSKTPMLIPGTGTRGRGVGVGAGGVGQR
jgi:protein-S-isoprenylcysteine O-methyltransferase Ste14